ncbi:MAG: hypothetical protein WA700_15575 [Acidobacteriaceae bacterium]
MSAIAGSFLKLIGYFIFIVGGVWGFILCLAIIVKVVGFWGVVASIVLAPVTLIASPVYAGFAWHNWLPLALIYGSGFGSSAIIVTGQALFKE